MILYKYVGFDAGLKILETNTLGFSLPRDFNDPFEVTALALKGETVNFSVETVAVRNRFINKYAVLCLTRVPLNPLMWSHYADSHKGVVIGIDTEKAGLENFNDYVIPAQRGEMIYLNTVPKLINSINSEQLMQIGNPELIFWESNERLLKHAFLYKQLCWAYEEEVRVVKRLGKGFDIYRVRKDRVLEIDEELWQQIYINNQPLFLKEVSSDSFVEVYMGVNSYVDQLRKTDGENNSMQVPNIQKLKNICLARGIKLHALYSDLETWTLKSKLL